MSDDVSVDPRKLAAVVYDDGVAVDALLLAFAERLGSEGVRVGGVVQVPRLGPGCGPKAPLQLRDLADGEVFPICQDLGGGANDCGLDPTKLRQAAWRIRSAAETSGLVVVSRFGKEEARGKGFRDELAHAAAFHRPVLTAVHRGRVDNWLAFTEGIGTLLDARLWVLEDWWREIGGKARVAA
jgi:nucleoside-triphosphatase THEP1